jgi:hypothetical protein
MTFFWGKWISLFFAVANRLLKITSSVQEGCIRAECQFMERHEAGLHFECSMWVLWSPDLGL